jgi:hypothetical protein
MELAWAACPRKAVGMAPIDRWFVSHIKKSASSSKKSCSDRLGLGHYQENPAGWARHGE